MIYTTLNQIRARGPCAQGWAELLAHLGKTKADDEALSFAVILASNGIQDALWCLMTIDEPALCRRLAVAFAREVQHLMKDPRSPAALDVAEKHASGLASDEELAEARRGAAYAAYADAAAYAAYAAADAAYAAYADAYATYADAAAYAAAYAADAAYAAADADAAYAAYAADAADAAYTADAADAAYAEMRAKQSTIFLKEISK